MTFDEIKKDLMEKPNFRSDIMGEISVGNEWLMLSMIQGNQDARVAFEKLFDDLWDEWTWAAICHNEYDAPEDA